MKNLKMIPLVFAGWLRYLMGVDDQGNTFELSPDPLLDTLLPVIRQIRMGDSLETVERILHPVLENEQIFGVNLYHIGLAELVCKYFTAMLQGPGSVEKLLVTL